jgi:hypothetical protein
MSGGAATVLGIVLLLAILWFIMRFFDSKNETLKGLAWILGFILLAIMFLGSNNHI